MISTTEISTGNLTPTRRDAQILQQSFTISIQVSQGRRHYLRYQLLFAFEERNPDGLPKGWFNTVGILTLETGNELPVGQQKQDQDQAFSFV